MKTFPLFRWLALCQLLTAAYADAAPEVPPGAPNNPASAATVAKLVVSNNTHVVAQIKGWTVIVNRTLLEGQREPTNQALELLKGQLEVINKIVPAPALAQLHKVPLWINPLHREGDQPKAEYHPGAGWLRDNNRDPLMAKGVEFTNVAIFAKECRRMPMFVLHELAHAYHDRFLGFEQPEILAAYKQALEGGMYKNVDRWNGTAISKADAYALTNAREYFAETTEAFFGRNDFQPVDRRVEVEGS